MRKILFVTGEYPPDSGGIGTMVYELASGLQKRGWGVAVLAFYYASSPQAIETFISQEPYPIWKLKNKRDWQSIQKAIHDFRPEVMITGDLPLTFVVWLLGTLHRIPVIPIGYGSEFRRSSLPIRLLKQLVYKTSRHVIMISRYTASLAEGIGAKPKRMSILHPAGDGALRNVDSDFLRERYGLQGKRVLLTMGTVSERKGQDKVLSALPEIVQKYPDVHYLIAGRDSGKFAGLAKALRLEQHVTFTGSFHTQEKAAFFSLAEFCIIASHSLHDGNVEGFGIVVLEAALCGKTSIGTLGTGIEETMRHEETGLLVPQADIPALRDAIFRLLDDAELRKTLETNAFQEARENGTWEKRVEDFERLLASL
jgi:phosphatidylinositol alpha-1,6-mannosyltransferase